jgi:CBS domain-containing protein/anti-sigma regulatory factor (Ser/Thr protein kinase)
MMTPAGFDKRQIINDDTAKHITRVEELGYELIVDEVMTHDIVTFDVDMQMHQVLEIARNMRISGAPVTKNGELVGVVSMEDLIRSLYTNNVDASVTEFMTADVITVRSNDPVVEALKVFVSTGVGRLPVLDKEGKLAGILTKGDVSRGLLKALQQDYASEELRKYRASHLFEDIESDRSSLILRYNIKQGDFTNGGAASSNIKKALLRLGATPQLARRCSIAVYEAEMNLIIHTTNGGVIRVEIEPNTISIRVVDDGPGIEDIDQALKPGFSTASEKIRELGFGAGMGLVNISRCVDEMIIKPSLENGTLLKMRIRLEKTSIVRKDQSDIGDSPHES